MTENGRNPATATIVVEDFDGDGRGLHDHLWARLNIDGVPTYTVTFNMSHIDFMRISGDSVDEISDLWDRAIEEMAARLAAEVTYAGLLRFDNPISVQSHVSSAVGEHRSGLREPGTVLVTFEI